METATWISIIMWVAGVAAMAGMTAAGQKGLRKDINRLEVKVDKHNNFMERIATAQADIRNIKCELEKHNEKITELSKPRVLRVKALK